MGTHKRKSIVSSLLWSGCLICRSDTHTHWQHLPCDGALFVGLALWTRLWKWRACLPIWQTPSAVAWRKVPQWGSPPCEKVTVIGMWEMPLVQVAQRRYVMAWWQLQMTCRTKKNTPTIFACYESLMCHYSLLCDVTLIPFPYKAFCFSQCDQSRSLLVCMGIHSVGLSEGPRRREKHIQQIQSQSRTRNKTNFCDGMLINLWD